MQFESGCPAIPVARCPLSPPALEEFSTEEEKRRRHPKKSLAQKIADREELLKQAQEKIMGYSISDLRRFLKQHELEQVKNEPESESRPEPQIHEETQ